MDNNYKYEDWKEIIESSNLPNEVKVDRMDLVRNLYKNNVPVIVDLKHLSNLLGIKYTVLASMIFSTSSFYREFKIPKKSGGLRTIVTPYKSLLTVQKWIVKNILSQFKIHDDAYAYVKNRNIALNAKQHIGNPEMLKIDLKDFFHTIKIPRVRELFNRLGYSKEVAGYLSNLCCLNEALPQGAGSSPIISNIILRTLDNRLSNIASKSEIVYSRYADDLVFSGSKIPLDFEVVLTQKINDFGFKLNLKKTKFYKKGDRKLVTGVVVNSDGIRLPKSKRKQIKKEVYYLKKYGIQDQVFRHNDVFYIDRILGKLSFWKQIEPKNEFVLTSIIEIRNMYDKTMKNNKD
ncbi:Retron-type RNA-directed DNA polymerase [Nonlabens tegetincola]|uniref:RNA-directed DNA polymerase n=1 Tax=Nonlabens tegetincola TaxID=323273 RepID=A0A090Q1D7_9FLAO|nr:retron St85 family RNA-directed DNA polymerase [Nonlabens tegetincola]GAK95508.1 Retron-type RNA-directed DNA polymerase [Nonlabens tegetincola]